jgi:hypothetical protein
MLKNICEYHDRKPAWFDGEPVSQPKISRDFNKITKLKKKTPDTREAR